MHRTVKIDVRNRKKTKGLYDYFKDICRKYATTMNVTNFHIRQHMTGLGKSDDELYPNQKKSIELFREWIPVMTERSAEYHEKRKRNIMADSMLTQEEKESKISSLKPPIVYELPTAEKWYLGYNLIEGVLRLSGNEYYRSLPAHVNAEAVKDTCESWKSYFSLLKCRGLTGKPKPPEYIKDSATVTFSNQVCRIVSMKKKSFLIFPKTKYRLNFGTYINSSVKICEVKVKPVADYFRVYITVDEPDTCTGRTVDKPTRVAAIDTGGVYIITVTNNVGARSVLISGNWIRDMNRSALSAIDFAKSIMRKGLSPNDHTKPHTSKKIKRMFARRDRRLDDYFHKISLFVVRYCMGNKIDTLVIGRNRGMKQKSGMGKPENRDFNYIPFARLYQTLKYLCSWYGINYIETEESYTSKASFFGWDEIPAHGEDDGNIYDFSGRRINRDTYVTADGIKIHADINGSLNIMRKALPDVCRSIKIQNIMGYDTLNYDYFYPTSKVAV